MENTLLLRTEASYSLNFLVYLQNLFLNKTQSREEMKFPYILSKCEFFREDFKMRYRELWDEVSKRISENPLNDMGIFVDKKNLFYQCLFVQSEEYLIEYNEIYHSFKVWWGSFTGHIAVERSIDVYVQEIYQELADLLLEKRINLQKDLNISIIYDECVLVDLKPTSYFAVFTIRDFFVNYKELIPKLVLSID